MTKTKYLAIMSSRCIKNKTDKAAIILQAQNKIFIEFTRNENEGIQHKFTTKYENGKVSITGIAPDEQDDNITIATFDKKTGRVTATEGRVQARINQEQMQELILLLFINQDFLGARKYQE
ncbi:MAG: hypothetical protein GY804_13375 [Alphaproteobacteria bacterium]|nr:hypothetical protein [Alphaproteobacteria bacterium]